METRNVEGVDIPYKMNGRSPVRVDIVADNNGRQVWIKVIARNPKALTEIALGRTNYGEKSILDHAKDYIEMTKYDFCCFQTPKVNNINNPRY